MTSVLDSLADKITVRLRDEENEEPHTILAVRNIERVIKDEIRKGAFISDQQLEKMLNNLVVDNQPCLFSESNKNE